MHLQAIDAPPLTLQSQLADSSIGVATVDGQGHVVDCNPAYSLQLGDNSVALNPQSKAKFADALSQPSSSTLVLETVHGATIVVQLDQLRHNVRIATSNLTRTPLDQPLQSSNPQLCELQLLVMIDRWLKAEADDRPGASLLCLSLDGIDSIRDTIGRDASEKLWALVIGRIEKSIQAPVAIARLAGNEIGAFVCDDRRFRERQAEAVAQLLDVLERPYFLTGRQVQLRAYIGLNDHIDLETSAESALRHTALARRHAASRAESPITRFSPELELAAREQLELEIAIGRAVWMDELQVAFQPLVDLQRHQVLGFEALMRWHSASHGSVSPATFIPIAERTGAILGMGEWVLREACANLQQIGPDLTLSVNVSPVQLESDSFFQIVTDALNDTGFEPTRLSLEVTEGILVEATSRSLGQLQRLRELGIKIAIDDFGTGYSSLAYLLDFPVDILKIDRSFLIGEQSSRSRVLIDCIVDLASKLGLKCVVEGVETEEQYQRLCRIGCDIAQGFLLGRPLPANQLRGFLTSAPINLGNLA